MMCEIQKGGKHSARANEREGGARVKTLVTVINPRHVVIESMGPTRDKALKKMIAYLLAVSTVLLH